MSVHVEPLSSEPYTRSSAAGAPLNVAVIVCAAVLVMKSELLVPVSFENVSTQKVVVGAAVSTVTDRPEDAEDVFPAASVALAVMVWLPAVSADDVIDQLPPVAVPVPSTVVPSVSYSVTVLPLSAVPVKVGVVALVMLSVLELPVSVPAVISGVEGVLGAVVSNT